MTHVTHHADQRLRRRFGVPRRTVARLAEAALAAGATRDGCDGAMRRYLDNLAREGTEPRVLGDHVFIFYGETLVAGWPLPPAVRRARRRHREAPA